MKLTRKEWKAFLLECCSKDYNPSEEELDYMFDFLYLGLDIKTAKKEFRDETT